MSTPKIKIISKNIPKELKQLNQWVNWKYVSKGDGEFTKPPTNGHGQRADHQAISLSFEEAYSNHKQRDFLGCGVSLRDSDGICGIDIDKIFDESGKWLEEYTWLKDLINKFPKNYIEISPSGKGLRIFGGGNLKTYGSRKGCPIEAYTTGRYLTVTGNLYNGSSKKLHNIEKAGNELVKAVHKHCFKEKLDDEKKPTSQSIPSWARESPRVIKKKLKAIRPGGYDQWREIGMAIHYLTNGSAKGLKLWDKWSQRDKEQYKAHGIYSCATKWKSFSSDKDGEIITGGKLNYYFNLANGVDPEILPFDKDRFSSGNELSADLFPEYIQRAGNEVARFNRVNPGPVFSSILSIFSAAINKKATIIERVGVEHNCHLGFIIAMPSGGRKSAIDNNLITPYVKKEAELQSKWKEGKSKRETEKKLLETQYKELMRDANEKDLFVAANLKDRIVGLEKPFPFLIASDISEEDLSNLMSDNKEVMFIWSDEGRNIISNILGRYSSEGGISIHLCGLTGSQYKRFRVTNDTKVSLSKPCLNELIKVQKDAIVKLVIDPRFIESGLAARFFMSVVDMDVAEQMMEEFDEPDLDYKELNKYYQTIKALLESDSKLNMVLSNGAKKQRVNFSHECAELIRNGRWKGLEDITNKSVSRSVVIASILEIMKDPDKFTHSGDYSEATYNTMTIKKSTYITACEITRVLIGQTLDVLQYSRNDEDKGVCLRLANRLKKRVDAGEWNNTGIFPPSTAQQELSGDHRKNYRDYIEILEARGYIIQVDKNKYRLNNAFEGV